MLLIVFKCLGRSSLRFRGLAVFEPLKYLGPIIVCVVAIMWTYFGQLYLSPGCTGYDSVANTPNVYVASLVDTPSAWNVCTKATTAVNFLGVIETYYPPCDNPGCVAMVRCARTEQCHAHV